MMQLDISFDLTGITADLDHFSKGMPGAISRAVNRTGDQVATAMARQLADETGLGVRVVKDAFDIERATAGDASYTITVPSIQTTLADFAPHQTRQGVSAAPWDVRRVFSGGSVLRGCRSRSCSGRT